MDNIELLNKAYVLRNAFIHDIKEYTFSKIVNTASIYDTYYEYINELTYDDNDYLDIDILDPFKLKSAHPKKISEFFFWIYNMVSNVHNAFISRFYNDLDISQFFSGFSLNDDILIADALDIFSHKAPYDIEYVELLSPFDNNDLDIIKSNNLIDLFFLYQFTSYFSKKSFILYINYLDYFVNKKGIKDNYIYNFCLNFYKSIIK